MMNFKEAMIELANGVKVTRQQWKGSIYFKLEDNHVKCYQPELKVFVYDGDIMLSGGWFIIGNDEDPPKELTFSDIVTYLINGKKANRIGWSDEAYIYYSYQDKYLIIHDMVELPYAPDFYAFVATDWITV